MRLPFFNKPGENTPETVTPGDEKRVPEDAIPSDTQTPPRPDTVKYVFYGDEQHHYVARRGPIQSRIFDQQIGTALRPQALDMAAPILQRETERLIEDPYGAFAGYDQWDMGDGMDVSNLPEWAFLLDARDEDTGLDDVMREHGIADASIVKDWSDLYVSTLTRLNEAPPPMAEGNHDGAYVGNGLNHTVDPTDLLLRKFNLEQTARVLEHKIERAQRKMDATKTRGRRSAWKRELEKLALRLGETRAKIADIETELENYSLSQSETPQNELNPLPGWFINLFLNLVFAVPRGRNLFDPRGYAAQNAGGVDHIIDKKKFISLYLSSRYREVSPDPDKLDETAVTLEYFDEANGHYRTDQSHFSDLDDTQPENVEKNFNNFWREIRPGEYLCLFTFPGREHASANQKYILLQAFDTGPDASGRRTFNLILDGMDSTEELVPSAFFGVLSTWQRRLCELFTAYQRIRHAKTGCLFFHSCHFPLQDLSKRHWKESGWLDYFSHDDVAPVFFAGHRHGRAIIDATLRHFFGIRIPFGTPSMKRAAAYSLVNPSATDNLEFMSVESGTNPKSGDLDVTLRYHQIVPDDRAFDPEVVATVDALAETYRQNRYREFSEMGHDFLTSAYNVFLTDQQGILAFDSIPISIAQYEETVVLTRAWLGLVKQDFGDPGPQDIEAAKIVEADLREDAFEAITRLGLPREDMFLGDFDAKLADLRSASPRPRDVDAALEAWNAWQDAKRELFRVEFPGRVERTLTALEERQRTWLTEYRRVKDKVANLPRREQIRELVKFNDIFDTPSYEFLRYLIAETPQTESDHRAYDFWLLIGKRAAMAEAGLPLKGRALKKAKKHGIPDQVEFHFDLAV